MSLLVYVAEEAFSDTQKAVWLRNNNAYSLQAFVTSYVVH